jgi:hypothetical protein
VSAGDLGGMSLLCRFCVSRRNIWTYGDAASFSRRNIHFTAVLSARFVRYEIPGSGRGGKGKRSMAFSTPAVDSETSALVTSAFEKSWNFVRSDPELAHNDMNEMRALLSRHITRLAKNGERDLWRLANSAIGELRRERSAA